LSTINSQKTWRLIPLLNASGAVQMAVDTWLLEQHRQGKHPPTLRFYTWNPGAISLGYHQQDYPQFWQELPLDIVRRPTGGKAVLHQGDLTYAVITSSVSGKRWETYKYICQFLINGWRSLNVNLDYGIAAKKYINYQNCFATATGADLVTEDGKKAIGSAQLRRRKVILQHGSMTLKDNSDLFIKIFNEPAPQNLLTIIPSSENRTVPTIVEALTESAKDWFKINLVLQPLSLVEWQDILTKPVSVRY
jgi:lipoate---protein ligase